MTTETCPIEIPSELVRGDTEDSEVVSLGVDILLPQITRLETEKSKSQVVIYHFPEDDDIVITPSLTPDSINKDIPTMEIKEDSISPVKLELNINEQVKHQMLISSVNNNSTTEVMTLTVNPQQQQNIIEKLLLEAESLKKELKKLEAENKALSDENSIQQSRGIEAINALRERDKNRWDATTYLQTLLKQEQILSEPLHYCDRLTLLRVAVEAASRLRATDVSLQHYKTKYKELKARQEQIMEQQKSHQELQEAHLLQSKFIQKLQKRQSKMDAFKNTIEMQERVISKMQTVIEQRLQSHRIVKAESQHPSILGLPHTTKESLNGKVPTKSDDSSLSSSIPLLTTSLTASSVNLPESPKVDNDHQLITTTISSIQEPSISSKEVIENHERNGLSSRGGELSNSLPVINENGTSPQIVALTTERDELLEQLNLSKEKIQELELQLESDQSEIIRLTNKVDEQANSIQETEKKLEAALKKNDELVASVTSKTIRISAIEEQLIASAHHSATEISKLRTKLFEIEMGTDNDNNNGEEDVDEDYIDGQAGIESEIIHNDSNWNFDVTDKVLEFKDEDTVINLKSPRLARSLSVTDTLEKKQSNINLLASSSATLLPERQSFQNLSPRLESLVVPLSARNVS